MNNWNELASEETLEKVLEGMKSRGFEVTLVNTKEEALQKAIEIIPEGSSVMNGSSTTLQEIGMIEELQKNTKWENLHTGILVETDPKKRSDLYRMAVTADYFLASPNAITEDGILVAVDRTGSRTGAIPYAAKTLLLISGTNKIQPTLELAMQRVREFVFPLEDKRAQAAYGTGSAFGKWVIVEHEVNPNRIKVILVKEKLGF